MAYFRFSLQYGDGRVLYIALIAEQVNDTHNFCEFFLDAFAQLFYYLSFCFELPLFRAKFQYLDIIRQATLQSRALLACFSAPQASLLNQTQKEPKAWLHHSPSSSSLHAFSFCIK
jgi:Sec-independent protein secretion pathway component TatC